MILNFDSSRMSPSQDFVPLLCPSKPECPHLLQNSSSHSPLSSSKPAGPAWASLSFPWIHSHGSARQPLSSKACLGFTSTEKPFQKFLPDSTTVTLTSSPERLPIHLTPGWVGLFHCVFMSEYHMPHHGVSPPHTHTPLRALYCVLNFLSLQHWALRGYKPTVLAGLSGAKWVYQGHPETS